MDAPHWNGEPGARWEDVDEFDVLADEEELPIWAEQEPPENTDDDDSDLVPARYVLCEDCDRAVPSGTICTFTGLYH